MKNKKWVQHISRQGRKFELVDIEQNSNGWLCEPEYPGDCYLRFPKSEYVECEGPERWHECTRQIISITDICEGDAMVLEHRTNGTRLVLKANGTRWAWKGDALVVERKVP
jgi:hypothetical protein